MPTPPTNDVPTRPAPDSASLTLADALDAAEVEGLAVDKQPTGYTASIFYSVGNWSPREFAATASEAIEKALRLHGSKKPVAPVTMPLAPPPY